MEWSCKPLPQPSHKRQHIPKAQEDAKGFREEVEKVREERFHKLKNAQRVA